MNFPFICRSISAALAYRVYTSQLIRYCSSCGSYHDFLFRGLLPKRKLNHGFSRTWLTVTEWLCHKWPRICSVCHTHNPVLSSFMAYHWVCN